MNAFYENGTFYVITHGCSNKMRQIAEKPKKAFFEWIDNGHNDFQDENTCLLCIKLTEGCLLSHGTRYDIDFSK